MTMIVHYNILHVPELSQVSLYLATYEKNKIFRVKQCRWKTKIEVKSISSGGAETSLIQPCRFISLLLLFF